jgi:hypothetical protein
VTFEAARRKLPTEHDSASGRLTGPADYVAAPIDKLLTKLEVMPITSVTLSAVSRRGRGRGVAGPGAVGQEARVRHVK